MDVQLAQGLEHARNLVRQLIQGHREPVFADRFRHRPQQATTLNFKMCRVRPGAWRVKEGDPFAHGVVGSEDARRDALRLPQPDEEAPAALFTSAALESSSTEGKILRFSARARLASSSRPNVVERVKCGMLCPDGERSPRTRNLGGKSTYYLMALAMASNHRVRSGPEDTAVLLVFFYGGRGRRRSAVTAATASSARARYLRQAVRILGA